MWQKWPVKVAVKGYQEKPRPSKIMETGAAARKMNEAMAEEKFRSAQLRRQIFAATAESYRGKGNALHLEDDLAPGDLRTLAQAISEAAGGTAAVLTGADGKWDVCLANPGGDVKELGSRMAKALDGRGGGKPGFFQGSLRTNKEDILRFFADFCN